MEKEREKRKISQKRFFFSFFSLREEIFNFPFDRNCLKVEKLGRHSSPFSSSARVNAITLNSLLEFVLQQTIRLNLT
jgi:hypothetical protein